MSEEQKSQFQQQSTLQDKPIQENDAIPEQVHVA